MAALDFPDNPATGDLYGSSGTVWRWDGSVWNSTAGASGARGRVAYSQATASQGSITALTALTGLSVAWTADPTRTYRTTVVTQVLSTVANDVAQVFIKNQSAADVTHAGTYLMTVHQSLIATVVESGISGPQNRTAYLNRAVGTGSLTNISAPGAYAFILVEDITYEAGTSGTPGSSLTGLEAARPGGSAGSTYFATDTKRQFVHDGVGWIIMSEPAQNWVPVWAGATVIGSNTGGYHRSDGYVDAWAIWTVASGGSIGAGLALTLPFESAVVTDLTLMRGNYAPTSSAPAMDVFLGGGISTHVMWYTKIVHASYQNIVGHNPSGSISNTYPAALTVGTTFQFAGRWPMKNKYS